MCLPNYPLFCQDFSSSNVYYHISRLNRDYLWLLKNIYICKGIYVLNTQGIPMLCIIRPIFTDIVSLNWQAYIDYILYEYIMHGYDIILNILFEELNSANNDMSYSQLIGMMVFVLLCIIYLIGIWVRYVTCKLEEVSNE